MSNDQSRLILFSIGILVGCGKVSEAGKAPAVRPAQASSLAAPQPFETASSAPQSAAAFNEDMQVEIQGAEIQAAVPGVAAAPIGHSLLGILVRVTSQRELPRPLVEPRRFTLVTADGRSIAPRISGRKEPALGSSYLKKGETVKGWLTFEVPADSKKIVLKTDLRRPPLSLPIPAAATPEDRAK